MQGLLGGSEGLDPEDGEEWDEGSNSCSYTPT